MSIDASNSTISIFSRTTGMLTGGIALALVGGYLAFGAIDSNARMGAEAAVAAGATGEDVITRRGLRSVASVAGSSFETGRSAILSIDEERITRRGLRSVPQSSGPFTGADQSTAELAILLADDNAITRRGLR